MIFTAVLEFLMETAVSLDFLLFLKQLLYSISNSTNTHQKIQKYTLWILKELYTTILRHRLIGCLVCNSKEKTLFKFDRY